mmetsp:Transcript_13656/g.31540  ORF Transcript_13656/g.31540 Transcript_13656/m.31540 type:complete len:257 (-) Transcript_13656:354-1124(-)
MLTRHRSAPMRSVDPVPVALWAPGSSPVSFVRSHTTAESLGGPSLPAPPGWWPARASKRTGFVRNRRRTSVGCRSPRSFFFVSFAVAVACPRSSLSMRDLGRALSSSLEASVDAPASSSSDRTTRRASSPPPSPPSPPLSLVSSRTSLMVKAACTCPLRPTTDIVRPAAAASVVVVVLPVGRSTSMARVARSVGSRLRRDLARMRAQSRATFPCPITTILWWSLLSSSLLLVVVLSLVLFAFFFHSASSTSVVTQS